MINAAECIKQVNAIGYTEYHNICTGEFASIIWGGVDWVMFAVLAVGLVGVVLVMCLLLLLIIRGW